MKKAFILFLALFILSFPIFSIAQTYTCSFDMGSSGTGTGIVTDTNCNQTQYYPVIGPLCKDSTTNLIYTGTGTGVVQSGVTMTLTGASSASTTTASDGTYAFAGLRSGSYTITPSMTGYTFSPTSISATISSSNLPGENFTSSSTTSTPSYILSGGVVKQ